MNHSANPEDFTLHAEPYTDGSSAILSLRCPKYDDNATPTVADIQAAIAAHEHVLIG